MVEKAEKTMARMIGAGWNAGLLRRRVLTRRVFPGGNWKAMV
jgi:hypothetical protein